MLELEHWRTAWEGLRCSPRETLLDELLLRYDEPHRAYHTRRHLAECFAQLEWGAQHADRLPEIALALWFHDAIYDPRAGDNEEQSAAWAVSELSEAGVSPDAIDEVEALVLATRHDAAPQGSDACLLVDVDLSILGASEVRFDEYERQVRAEYEWVPEAAYREGRTRILEGFLARPAIYATPWFGARLEEPAQRNLRRSLERLRG